MFTPESAVSSFRNILERSATALEQEVSYAQNQMIRMEDAIVALNPIEFDRAAEEFTMAMRDCAVLINAGQHAVMFLAVAGLTNDQEYHADAIGEADAECKKMSAIFADVIAQRQAEFI